MYQAIKCFGLYNKGKGIALPGYILRKRFPYCNKIDTLIKDIVNINMYRKNESELDFFILKIIFLIII